MSDERAVPLMPPNQTVEEADFFGDDLLADNGNDNTARVIAAFKTWQQTEEELATTKAVLEGLEETVNKIKNVTMPDLLKEMGTELWRDPDSGLTVELETNVNSSLPKDKAKRNAVLDALRPIGIEQIMAEEFTVTFSPNDKRAVAIRELLGLAQPDVIEDSVDGLQEATTGYRLTNEQVAMIHDLRASLGLADLPSEEKLGVHPSRLKSWLKEQIGRGFGQLILDAGIWHGKQAKMVVAAKGKKGKK